jgi:hypothetical protein
MCDYHTWFYSDKTGYVIECTDCSHLQLGFGNILMTFEKGDFDLFAQYIKKCTDELAPDPERHIKSISLKTPCKGISMLLTEAELYGLNDMVDRADTEMRSSALLNLFHNQDR